MEKGVTTILFDLGGVILNLDYNLTIDAFKALGEENFEDLYTQANQNKTFDLFETGKISENEFRNYVRSFLGADVNDEMIDNAWNKMLLDLPSERIELLKELKKKYRIYLFSNTNAIHYKAFRAFIKKAYGNADLLETIFHKTYYSHILGARKPNAEAFKMILDEQGIQPEEVIFIDDSHQHIVGAGKLGIKTIHLKDNDMLTICKPFL